MKLLKSLKERKKKKRPFLFLWKLMVVLILLLASVSFVTISNAASFDTLKEKFKSGVWIDNNTYRLYFSIPYPEKITKSKNARQKYMKDHFPLECAYAALSHLKGNLLIGIASARVEYNQKTSREIVQAAKDGKIIMIRWNKNKTCEVILEIRVINLREKISAWVEYIPMK